jgi:predicted transcriptional regulator
MPSTTIHFPQDVLRKIDAVARRRGISRNRFVIQSCEQAVAYDSGQWPEDFFELSADNQRLLDQATRELEAAVLRNRASRGAPLL